MIVKKISQLFLSTAKSKALKSYKSGTTTRSVHIPEVSKTGKKSQNREKYKYFLDLLKNTFHPKRLLDCFVCFITAGPDNGF